jgi:phage baseplate assembly protein W
MQGIHKVTGKPLSDDEHLQQSVTDILTTPLGSRVMRRDYGFDFTVLAAPQNRATMMRVFIATVNALMKWEPRITVTQVKAERYMDGRMIVDIVGKKTTGEVIELQSAIG